MKTSIPMLTAFIFMFFFSNPCFAGVPLDVPIGKAAVVTLKKISRRVSLSDPQIADIVLLSPKEILINGRKIGGTSLIVWDDDGKSTFFDIVVTVDMERLIEEINALSDGIEVSMAGDSVILKGKVKGEETIKKILIVAAAYSPKVINFLSVEQSEQVLLEVKVAQIDKSQLKKLGANFLVKGASAEGFSGLSATPAGIIGGTGIGGFALSGGLIPEIGVAHFPSGVAFTLKALSEKGVASILAEPNLVVRNGEKGSFLVGSRVPVQQISGVGGAQTVSITFEEVGIKLNFIPQVLENGVIRLKIDPAEVSNIVQLIPIAGILAPKIDTREVRTSVDLKEGESLILAGLLSDEMKKTIRKIPLLGDIPFLGALFRSAENELVQKELTFFITPKLIKPRPLGEKTEIPGEKPLSLEEEREFRWIPTPGGYKR